MIIRDRINKSEHFVEETNAFVSSERFDRLNKIEHEFYTIEVSISRSNVKDIDLPTCYSCYVIGA
jgi:hypothetical protein